MASKRGGSRFLSGPLRRKGNFCVWLDRQDMEAFLSLKATYARALGRALTHGEVMILCIRSAHKRIMGKEQGPQDIQPF